MRRLSAFFALLLVGLIAAPATPAAAADYVPINGAGSSWSSNAVDQWRRNVQQYGMRVNYASTGSSDGRNQFKAGTVDFAVSETPYGLKDNGIVEALPSRGFAYMPIVAGGTSFMYNLTSGGKRITNLRLSGDVLTLIFTGEITQWNDKRIAADNPGLTLPKRKIVPVVRSDGSGSTAQFTLWMATEHQKAWDAYCKRAGRSTPCGQTSNFPVLAGAGFVAQPNSQGVSGYVAQLANEGTITYVEYSYALKTGFPVAKVLNAAGYYVEPTASNVAVGLLGAKINQDEGSAQYLTQKLEGVYRSTDPRSYPLSSYSYMIVPTQAQGSFTTDKGQTLAAFASYFLCEGQQQAEVLGYSPLPINLVKAGLAQVERIPGAGSVKVDIKKCNNPTFSSDGTNTLAKKAAMPSECDKKGVTQCTQGTGGAAAGAGGGTTASSGSGGSTTGSDVDTAQTAADAAASGDGDAQVAAGEDASVAGVTSGLVGPTACDADTGVCSAVAAVPVEAPAPVGWSLAHTIVLLIVALIGLLIVGPPVLALMLGRRR
ncbi:phosphate ABC transporter substrate-binding protein PstS [Microbacterium fluvii]|uniref:Phosphate ABC transporter substrate-binding protein PstS n=1 Tax=Microbacterium fluvii TaxID=415215 RepID=A0ABW2HFW5_9MICO|nr:phosphate ABC transporter substrate-binding protein PstS [Microbacterium fluvii]MCU4672511.1 phosphate ABC transporter substrate-binding protein PstS [Microbacterium fluvii]